MVGGRLGPISTGPNNLNSSSINIYIDLFMYIYLLVLVVIFKIDDEVLEKQNKKTSNI